MLNVYLDSYTKCTYQFIGLYVGLYQLDEPVIILLILGFGLGPGLALPWTLVWVWLFLTLFIRIQFLGMSKQHTFDKKWGSGEQN